MNRPAFADGYRPSRSREAAAGLPELRRWISCALDLLLPRARLAKRHMPDAGSPAGTSSGRRSEHLPPRREGSVALVGAGPGDVELLTLRAARLIREADAVVYDHLVGDGVAAFMRADAEKIYVGKESGNHTLPQGEINRLLVQLASQGKRVVRLKGGDPFVFGRGGEEIEELAAAGIRFEVVPGITAAAGMAAYAGIPLTHRDCAQSCTFVTGHLKDGSANLDWPALARPRQTVVIYMGIGALPEITRQLVAHGLSPDTPAALVRNATLATQEVVAGTLGTLPELAAAAGIRPPALVVVGEVVRLRARLNWFAPAHATSGD